MVEAGLGRGAARSVSDRGQRSSRLRRLRRWARRAGALLPLCATLVAIGVGIASFGQTRIETEAPSPREEVSSARSGAGLGREGTGRASSGAAAGDAALITEGVTLQVLNATPYGRADNRMAELLRSLGFRVPAMNPAATRYERTTVFWSRPQGRPAAEALAARFGWRAERKPRNLSASVTAHVVVGRDWARGA